MGSTRISDGMRVMPAWRVAALLLLVLTATSCETERERVAQAEQLLAAAGFRMQPADTPERQAQLNALPPHQLLAQPLQVNGQSTVGYIYADPNGCHCLWVGDATAFQAYEQLAVQKQIADEHLRAAMMEENARFDWGLWGSPVWGPAPIVVVRRR
jgi:hypothetical protein